VPVGALHERATEDDAFTGVVGQPKVVAELRRAAAEPVHAYLLVGPPGAGAGAAATAFSAALLCPQGGCGHCRDCRLALAGEHPDAVTFAPEGAYLRLADAEEIARLALRSPVEGARKVLVLTEFHRVLHVAPALLKTIEEPPPSTVFVILADDVPPELVTIASRCVRIDVGPLPAEVVRDALVGDGVDEDRAAEVATAALGDLARARLLAADGGLADRQRMWRSLPARLDGTGAAVVVEAAALLERIEEAAEPLKARQAAELEALEERVARSGERGAGRRALADQHKRELRRHRAAELRFGLATLAAAYRDELVDRPGSPGAPGLVDAVDALTAANEALLRNPNDTLLLQSLLLRLPQLVPASTSTE
jgi:DNA polymerase-3 subunit delta'